MPQKNNFKGGSKKILYPVENKKQELLGDQESLIPLHHLFARSSPPSPVSLKDAVGL